MFRSVPYVNTVLFLCLALLIEQFSFIRFLVYSLVYYSFLVCHFYLLLLFIFFIIIIIIIIIINFVIFIIVIIIYGLWFGSLVNIFRKMITSSLDVN